MNAKLMAVNSDSETCEKCGKTGLKRVMWIETEETGIMAYGVCCGARALGFNGKITTIEQIQKAVERLAELDKVREDARKLAQSTGDEVAIIKVRSGYGTVRARAYDANPTLYGFPVEWVK